MIKEPNQATEIFMFYHSALLQCQIAVANKGKGIWGAQVGYGPVAC